MVNGHAAVERDSWSVRHLDYTGSRKTPLQHISREYEIEGSVVEVVEVIEE